MQRQPQRTRGHDSIYMQAGTPDYLQEYNVMITKAKKIREQEKMNWICREQQDGTKKNKKKHNNQPANNQNNKQMTATNVGAASIPGSK